MQNSLSKNIDAIVSAKDLANAVEDEFGVKYSKDGLRLLKSNENITNYVVKAGTRFPKILKIILLFDNEKIIL